MDSHATEIVASAAALALVNPLPVMAVIALLFSPRGGTTAPAFLIGWVAGLVGMFGLLTFVVSAERLAGDDASPSTFASVARVALGLLLLGLALRKWQGRGKGGLPGWMTRLEQAGPAAAFGLGALLAALNPKNLAFTVSSAFDLAAAGLPAGRAWGLIALFAVVGSLGVGVPVVWHAVAGESARRTLATWRTWLTTNYGAVMAVVFVVFGVVLLSKGVSGLTK